MSSSLSGIFKVNDHVGALVTSDGTRFKLWAPAAKRMEVLILDENAGLIRSVLLRLGKDGWFEGLDGEGAPGDHYKLRINGAAVIPDPASRFQPTGPHGASMVIDASSFAWCDQGWKRPGTRDLVIYELHVGTFTIEGTFRAAIEKLPHIRDLGANAIELMPVTEFAGSRNWGYDGVCMFAPEHEYGHPDDLRSLVDEAHRQGIAVILDVVYNHFGPDGNYLDVCAGDYLDETKKTPWGGAIRYGHSEFAGLRRMVLGNVKYWMRDFHIDGFRLDATHAIFDSSPVHLLQEVTSVIDDEGCFAIAEDCRNESKVCEPLESGGWGFDAVWADDFHHSLRVGQTHEAAGYLGDYTGSMDELLEILRTGWLYHGQDCKSTGGPRGTPCHHLEPACFITCISNHDQVGNRAHGERLHHTISPEAYRALSTLICLGPYTPLLFMGQEWGASSPFLFFTDHHKELGKLITEGRRGEFADFPEFNSQEARKQMPDPQDLATFLRSKLQWNEVTLSPHAQVLSLYGDCLRLRRLIPLLCSPERRGWRLEQLPEDLIAIHYDGEAQGHTLILHLANRPAIVPVMEICPNPASRFLLSSNEKRFGGERADIGGQSVGALHASGPEAILVAW